MAPKSDTGPRVQVQASLEELPADYASLLERAAKTSFYLSRPWFQNLAQTTFGPDESLRIYGLETGDGQAEALLIARESEGARTRTRNRELAGCSNLYTPQFGPIVRPGAVAANAIAAALVDALRQDTPAWDRIHFKAWDHGSPLFGAFAAALRDSGMLVQTYFHFGNAYDDVGPGAIDEYLERRPARLRNTLRRKQAKLSRSGRAHYQIYPGACDLSQAIDAYARVYAESWKQPEPFPEFTPGLIRAAAAAGALRLGILSIDDEPAAAQIWLLAGETASIYKLAHGERFKEFSPGSLLTLHVMTHVIEADGVREVDFGRGDDPYKGLWLSRRRERWGMLAFNPRSLRGALGAVRHIGGGKLKAALKSRGPGRSDGAAR